MDFSSPQLCSDFTVLLGGHPTAATEQCGAGGEPLEGETGAGPARARRGELNTTPATCLMAAIVHNY